MAGSDSYFRGSRWGIGRWEMERREAFMQTRQRTTRRSKSPFKITAIPPSVSCSDCNTSPQTRWLKTMFKFIVLEARIPKSKCRQATLSPKALGENLCFFQLLVVPGVTGLWLHHVTLQDQHLHIAFSSTCRCCGLN